MGSDGWTRTAVLSTERASEAHLRADGKDSDKGVLHVGGGSGMAIYTPAAGRALSSEGGTVRGIKAHDDLQQTGAADCNMTASSAVSQALREVSRSDGHGRDREGPVVQALQTKPRPG
jgi:hypothetical protein